MTPRPPTPREPTNEDRADAAQAALLHHAWMAGEFQKHPLDMLEDLLCDLRHWAKRERIDYAEADRLGAAAFEEESEQFKAPGDRREGYPEVPMLVRLVPQVTGRDPAPEDRTNHSGNHVCGDCAPTPGIRAEIDEPPSSPTFDGCSSIEDGVDCREHRDMGVVAVVCFAALGFLALAALLIHLTNDWLANR